MSFLEHHDQLFLNRAQQILAQDDTERGMIQLMQQLGQHLGCEALSVFVLDDPRERLELKYAVGPVGEQVVGLQMSVGQGVVGWVVEYAESLIVPSTELDPRFYSGVDAKTGFVTNSILCAPILFEDEVRGALEALNKTQSSFNDDNVMLLRAIANLIAEALFKPQEALMPAETSSQEPERTCLQVETQRPLVRSDSASAILDLMEQVNKYLGTEALSIFMLDESTNELVLQFAAGPVSDEIVGMRMRVGQGVVGWVVQYVDPLIVPAPGLDPRFLDDSDQETGFVTRSILCVPIVSEGKTLGAVEVLNKKECNFNDDDVVFMLDVAQTVVEILQRAKGKT